MENNVIISIKGIQSLANLEGESVELVTEGRLDQDGDSGYTLSYQESELTGLDGTLTTIQVEKRRVTLMRMGEYNSQMVFEEGRRHLSMYNTPYGALSIGIDTKKMNSALSAAGGLKSATPLKLTTPWRERTCSALTCGKRAPAPD